MTSKETANFLLDVVTHKETDGKMGGYISSAMHPLKSWFPWNDIAIVQKVKVSGKLNLRLSRKNPPRTPDVLRTILHAADLRAKTSISIIAFTGVRIEVLRDFLGDDVLKIKDIFELSNR